MIQSTPKNQQLVLDLLVEAGKPMVAYEILEEMRALNPKTAPPTVYRALGALTKSGQVHRLESLNAYVRCQHAHHDQSAVLSICDDCGTVEENVAPEILSNLASVLDKTGFAAKRHVIEVHGTCADCAPESAAP